MVKAKSSTAKRNFFYSPGTRHAYDRRRDLPTLLSLWPSEIESAAATRPEHLRLIAKLRRALRHERVQGVGGHWTYDLQRHAALLRAYRAEVRAYLEIQSDGVENWQGTAGRTKR